MGVTQVEKDFDRLTMVIVAEYDVPVERAWQLWADPRQLERWWGPPGYPATVEAHELVQGGRIGYFMTGPEGERYPGWWEVLEVQAPTRLVVRDGFALEDGTPNPELPETLMRVEFAGVEAPGLASAGAEGGVSAPAGAEGGVSAPAGGEESGASSAASDAPAGRGAEAVEDAHAAPAKARSVITMTSTFPSRQAFDEILAMGAEEGMKAAMSQIDGLLAG